MNSNSLNRFEEGSFKAMLEDMSGDSGGGYLEIPDSIYTIINYKIDQMVTLLFVLKKQILLTAIVIAVI